MSSLLIAYYKKQNDIKIGKEYLYNLTGLNVEYRSSKSIEEYKNIYWYTDEYNNDYELDRDTLTFRGYEHVYTKHPKIIVTNGTIEEMVVKTAKNISPEFFEYNYTIESNEHDIQTIDGIETETWIYIDQLDNGQPINQTFYFCIYKGTINDISLFDKNND